MNEQDKALRAEIIAALRQVELGAGIRSRMPYGRLADAVMQLGAFDVVLADGRHLYNSTHCRHGHPELCASTTIGDGGTPRRPSQCKGCGAPCHHTYPETEGTL